MVGCVLNQNVIHGLRGSSEFETATSISGKNVHPSSYRAGFIDGYTEQVR